MLPSIEEYQEMNRRIKEKNAKRKEEMRKARIKELEKRGVIVEENNFEDNKKHYDSEYTMENSTATFIWVVVMLVGTIFNDRWLIYVFATIIWLRFITRHKK